jgi:hypothetical protein
MRLLWFSPLPPAATDVANYTFRLAPHLHDIADVTFVHTGPARPSSWDDGRSTVAIGSLSTQSVNRADLCIYQIGNNPEFHGAILPFAQQHPGLVVLHDRSLQDFLFTRRPNLPTMTSAPADTYEQSMMRWYGQAGLEAAKLTQSQQIQPVELAARFPLFEAVLDKSLGVVCHNRDVTAEIHQRFPKLPFLTLPLPFAAPNNMPSRPIRMDTDPIRLVMFGFMGSNRRATEFLDAWMLCEQRDRFRLDLCGQMFDRGRFDARAAELRLSAQITHHGFLPEDELDALIRNADMALNLRHPTMGEASGSQLRIWANGCPSVVSSSGWYATLNERSVRKIGCDTEKEDLLLLLRDLAMGRINGEEIARRGFEQLSRHDPLRYVQNLLTWINSNLANMTARWTEAALMESVARGYARSLPWDFDVELPARLLGDVRPERESSRHSPGTTDRSA